LLRAEDLMLVPNLREEQLATHQLLHIHAPAYHEQQSLVEAVSKLVGVWKDQQSFYEGLDAVDSVALEGVVYRVLPVKVGLVHMDFDSRPVEPVETCFKA